jgi:hypothetical protein
MGEVVLLSDADKPLFRWEWPFEGIFSAIPGALDSSKSWNDQIECIKSKPDLLGRAA